MERNTGIAHAGGALMPARMAIPYARQVLPSLSREIRENRRAAREMAAKSTEMKHFSLSHTKACRK
jgi:hypothetical protein